MKSAVWIQRPLYYFRVLEADGPLLRLELARIPLVVDTVVVDPGEAGYCDDFAESGNRRRFAAWLAQRSPDGCLDSHPLIGQPHTPKLAMLTSSRCLVGDLRDLHTAPVDFEHVEASC